MNILRKCGTTGLALLLLLMASCASFPTRVEPRWQGPALQDQAEGAVSVAFIIRHIRQTQGLDAIPKVVGKQQNVTGFDEILGDALPELRHLGAYATFTEEAGDVNRPERRAIRDSLMAGHDITIRLSLESSQRFAPVFLGGLLSTCTLSLAPVPYVRRYHVKAEVLDYRRRLLATTERSAELHTWVQALLMTAYPFYPPERGREEIYLNFLHDVFRELEERGLLRAAT